MPLPAGISRLCLVTTLILCACSSSEIGQSRDVNQDAIYQQYSFHLDEQAGEATLYAQFRFAGEDGTTLVLDKPGGFEFDGKQVEVDSSEFAGAYYSTMVTAKAAMGNHTLLFTDIHQQKRLNQFSVDPFRLTGVPVQVDRAAPLIIHFEAAPLQADDYIELSSAETDSSFVVRHTAGDVGNEIQVPAAYLQKQRVNHFMLYGTLYRKISLQQATKQGGQVEVVQETAPFNIRIKDPAL